MICVEELMAKVCMPRNIVIFALFATQDVKGRVHSTQPEIYLDRKMPPTAFSGHM